MAKKTKIKKKRVGAIIKRKSRLNSKKPKKKKLKKRLKPRKSRSKKYFRKNNPPKKRTENKKYKSFQKSSAARYYLNYHFQFIDELKDLVLKSSPEEKEKMTENLLKLGRVKLAVATGIFLNRVNSEAVATDLFIVGDDINRRKLRSFLKSLEADVGKEVRYVIMEKEEFQYRIGMFDRFIRVLLEGPHEKLINRLGI